jgi:hypothetical protein
MRRFGDVQDSRQKDGTYLHPPNPLTFLFNLHKLLFETLHNLPTLLAPLFNILLTYALTEPFS